MLNSSLKNIVLYKNLAGLVELEFWPLENKKRSKNKKPLKTRFFIKIIKKRKKSFLHLWLGLAML